MKEKKIIGYICIFIIILSLLNFKGQVLAADGGIDYSKIIVTLSVRGADIRDVLLMLTEQSGINWYLMPLYMAR